MKQCMIISGAPVAGEIPVETEEYVIACDAGVGHALNAGIRPDLLVGDFDTYREKLPEGIPVLSAPAEKDDTDTMMAVRYALEQGFDRIRICAALGGRLDHSIGNLSAAAYVAERLGYCYVYGVRETAVLLYNRSIRFARTKENEYVSVFSWTKESKGVRYSGLKYPLEDAVLTREFALGISNEFTEEEAEIAVKDGMLLIVMSTD